MKRKTLLRNLSMAVIAVCFTIYGSYAQVFPGTLTVTNGEIDLSSGLPGRVQFNNGSVSGGVGGIGGLFFNIQADNFMQIRAESIVNISSNTSTISFFARQGTFAGGAFSDPNSVVQFGVRPSGTRNNIAHLESGSFGVINSTTSKWLGLGSAPAGAGASVYGKRIQWGENFAVFNLREASATDKDLVIQWGGTAANSQLLFEVASSPLTAPVRVMQMESNGNIGIGATPTATDKLRVNGRIRFGSVEYIEDGGPNAITVSNTLLPSIDNSRDLGSPTFRWDDVFATNGVIQTSDRRAKKDIKSLSYGLQEILDLRPVTYKWKKDQNKGEQIGLIAQDVQKVMTELVYDPKNDLVENEEGQLVAREGAENMNLGISYSAFIPVIINAMQEQQSIIEEQNDKINNLLTELEAMKSALAEQTLNTGNDGSDEGNQELEGARMIQNSPNPFNETTNVEYYLPESIQSATLYIYNMNGSLISKYALEDRGASFQTIKANSLPPGIYLYSIVADNKELGVKRMIIED